MNESFIQADIFFFVTTVIVAVVGTAVFIAVIYLIKILRDIDTFQKKMSNEAGEIIEDIKLVKKEVMKDGIIGRRLIHFLVGFIAKSARRIKRFKRNKL